MTLKLRNKLLFACLFSLIFSNFTASKEFCPVDNKNCQNELDNYRYLFYDVNPPEGFNLRRDVYMRMAILAHKLNQSSNPKLNKFKLILPPWSHLYHWKYSEEPEFIPWSYYFDLDSMKRFAPLIEMHEFFNTIKTRFKKVKIEETYILQHFEDMFESGNFEDRMQLDKCTQNHYPTFFYYENITSDSIQCLSYHGPATKLSELLLKSSAKSILLDHAEIALHDMFGDRLYWQARRSMRFNKELVEIANRFRERYLDSNDKDDLTIRPEDWTLEKSSREALGGPYLGVHLRRKDFVKHRSNQTPNLNNVAKQIEEKLRELELKTVFVASDAPIDEFEELKKYFSSDIKVTRYYPNEYVNNKFRDGGVAIIDQIICSHARFFIGTSESTFSFRIQEEREIMGFPIKSTFNSFCNDEGVCNPPSKWTIVY